MTKLKTLKDVLSLEGDCLCNGCQEGWKFCSQKELKEEAQKWAETYAQLLKEAPSTSPEYYQAVGVLLFIQKFFDIKTTK